MLVGRGGLRGTKTVNKNFVNKQAFPINFREKQSGLENSGEGKTYHKSPPQKRFWTPPHSRYDFPPPALCSRHVIFLRGNGHRSDESHFRRPPKLFLFFYGALIHVAGEEFQGALKGTNLRGQTEPTRRFSLIFADFCRFSPFP